MRTQEEDAGIRRAVAYLSLTCCDHGHFKELYTALQLANPALACKHWESTECSDEYAGLVLGMRLSEDDGRESFRTVLDEYLFGDSAEMLKKQAVFREAIVRASAKLEAVDGRRTSTRSFPQQATSLKRKPRQAK